MHDNAHHLNSLFSTVGRPFGLVHSKFPHANIELVSESAFRAFQLILYSCFVTNLDKTARKIKNIFHISAYSDPVLYFRRIHPDS